MPKGGPRPGAGRPPGSRNRRTRELQERLDRLGIDPVGALIRVAQCAEAEGDLTLAEKCWRGLLPYAGPRPTMLRQVPAGPDSVPASTSIELPSWWRPGRAS
jgi:hypothetical protein